MKDERADLYRMTGKTDTVTLIKTFLTSRVYRKLYYFRKSNDSSGFRLKWYRMLARLNAHKSTIDLPLSVKMGAGALFIHPYSIAINSGASIGYNFTMLKGSTVGNVKSGKHIGAPTIGNNVYLGLNSSIVGGYELVIM